MNTQPAVAGAAIIAGLIVGGGAYAARHVVGAPGVEASIAARSGLVRQIPDVPHVRLAPWHPVRLPRAAGRVTVTPPPAVAPTPVATAPAQAPVTRTSPAASGDDSSGEGGDD